IRDDGDGEHRPFDRDHSHRRPPHERPMPECIRGQPRDVDRGTRAHDSTSRKASTRASPSGGFTSMDSILAVSSLSGQNHPISVIATGTAPHTIAQGVNTLPMNMTVVSSAARKGQIDGLGRMATWSGSASCRRVTNVVRRISGSPVTSATGNSFSQSGVREFTTGMAMKLYAGGGQLVAHSSPDAFQGLSGARSRRRMLTTTFTRNTSMLTAIVTAPTVDSRL